MRGEGLEPSELRFSHFKKWFYRDREVVGNNVSVMYMEIGLLAEFNLLMAPMRRSQSEVRFAKLRVSEAVGDRYSVERFGSILVNAAKIIAT